MAVVDAEYNFRYINIGSQGSMHDSLIYNTCDFYKKLHSELKFPSSTIDNLPFYLIGDGAFNLSKNFLIPFKSYSNSRLSEKQHHFNLKISKVRVIIENVFGILTSRFRLFLNTMTVRTVRFNKRNRRPIRVFSFFFLPLNHASKAWILTIMSH